ncbi:MAG: ECF transporter S component [Treponemataceae bacterium]|nr:ECF transporter S component [Treponemataceae bacterium]
MARLPIRKIAVAGVLSALAIVLGLTRLGFIPWFSGASLTIMHVPAIIGAILEGPGVGILIGGLFGLFSLLQAALAPTGPVDVAFTNPLISIVPRLMIGLFAFLVYRGIVGSREGEKKAGNLRKFLAIGAAGVVGSLTNTVLVLGALGLFGFFPWQVIWTVAVGNGPAEAVVAALLTVAVVSAYWAIERGGEKARLSREA